MRLLLTFVGALVVFGTLLIALVSFANDPLAAPAQEVQYLIAGLIIMPIAFSVVAAMGVVIHSQAYHYQPLEDQDIKTAPREHAALGFVEAVTQDFTIGRIQNIDVYEPHMLRLVQSYLDSLQVYRDRGFELVFRFHHSEQYNAHTIRTLSENDIVVEVDGVFDYYAQRGQAQWKSPDPRVQGEPMISEFGIVRMRLTRSNENDRWHIAGYADNIAPLEIGLPVA